MAPPASFLVLIGTRIDWSNAKFANEGSYTVTITAAVDLDDAICQTTTSFGLQVVAPEAIEEEEQTTAGGPPAFQVSPDQSYEVECGEEITLPGVEVYSPAVSVTQVLI